MMLASVFFLGASADMCLVGKVKVTIREMIGIRQ